MRFDEIVVPIDAGTASPPTHGSEQPRSAREEFIVLEAKYKGLQALVAELLLTNQALRLESARLKAKLPG
jgi:hypothetical protein